MIGDHQNLQRSASELTRGQNFLDESCARHGTALTSRHILMECLGVRLPLEEKMIDHPHLLLDSQALRPIAGGNSQLIDRLLPLLGAQIGQNREQIRNRPPIVGGRMNRASHPAIVRVFIADDSKWWNIPLW